MAGGEVQAPGKGPGGARCLLWACEPQGHVHVQGPPGSRSGRWRWEGRKDPSSPRAEQREGDTPSRVDSGVAV